MKTITILLVLIALSGCEMQSTTRVAFFRKGENGGNVSRSRDIGMSTQQRKGNKVDNFLRKNITDRTERRQ